MGTELSLTVDVNQILSAFGGAIEARNDLVGIVANGTTLTLNVSDTVSHGNLGNATGTNPVTGVAAPAAGATTIADPTIYAVSVDAVGEGSELDLYITSGSYMWAIVLRSPSNAENYFQYTLLTSPVTLPWPLSRTVPVTQTSALAAAAGGQQYFANGGTQTFTGTASAPGTEVTIIMTNVSPATAQIQFIPA